MCNKCICIVAQLMNHTDIQWSWCIWFVECIAMQRNAMQCCVRWMCASETQAIGSDKPPIFRSQWSPHDLDFLPWFWPFSFGRHQREEEEEKGGLEELTAELTVEEEEHKSRTPQLSEEELHLWPHQLSLNKELSFGQNNTSEEFVSKLGQEKGDEVKEEEKGEKEVEIGKIVSCEQQVAPAGDTTRWGQPLTLFGQGHFFGQHRAYFVGMIRGWLFKWKRKKLENCLMTMHYKWESLKCQRVEWFEYQQLSADFWSNCLLTISKKRLRVILPKLQKSCWHFILICPCFAILDLKASCENI